MKLYWHWQKVLCHDSQSGEELIDAIADAVRHIRLMAEWHSDAGVAEGLRRAADYLERGE